MSEKQRSITAKNRSVAVGGSVVGSTIVTGDGNRVEQGASMDEFLALLEELRQKIRDAPLAADVAEDLEAEAADVERKARRDAPNDAMILGKLKTITELLSGAAGLGEKLVPLARRLGEMAAVLF
ncbi:MAG TPA: hypothetical protein VGG06_21490 [Thermoanaerobaculia bacterium]